MWRSHTSLSFGTWCYSLLALSVLLCASGKSDAAIQQWTVTCGSICNSVSPNTWGPGDLQAEVAAMQAALNANGHTGGGICATQTCTYTVTVTQGTWPAYTCTWSGTGNVSGTVGPLGCTVTATTSAVQQVCSAPGTYAFIGGGAPPGYACVDGCQYQTPQPTTNVYGSGGTSGPGVSYEGYSTGVACDSSAASTPTQASQNQNFGQCDSTGTICASGPQCGEFNGDQVCVNSINPGTCVQYSSGGVACAASGASSSGVTSPPGPGTSGTPSTPTAAVESSGGSGATTVNYYGPTVVASAGTAPTVGNPINPNPIGSQATGSNTTSSGGGGSGTVSVSGTVTVAGTVSVTPNAANGDCGAAGVSCAPSTPTGTSFTGDCASFSACLSGFYSSIQSAPLVAGAAAIESAWPSGTCDIGSVTLSTFGGQSFNYGTTACNVWTSYIQGPLSAILLAVYACAGIFIVLSA